MPNYTLYLTTGLKIEGSPVTVGTRTRLSDLLRPGMGECHWAVCLTGPPI